MHETEIRLGKAALKTWSAQLAQKKLFLEVFTASRNKGGVDMARDHIFDLESKIRIMKEHLSHLEPKPKKKLRRKKRGGK